MDSPDFNDLVRYVVFRVFDETTAQEMLARRQLKKSLHTARYLRRHRRSLLPHLQRVSEEMRIARDAGVLAAADNAYVHRNGPAAIDLIMQAVYRGIQGPVPVHRTCTGYFGINDEVWQQCA